MSDQGKTFIRKDDRVVDRRWPEIVGTARADSDRITKLVRIDWDDGRTSLVFIGVLSPASEARGAT